MLGNLVVSITDDGLGSDESLDYEVSHLALNLADVHAHASQVLRQFSVCPPPLKVSASTAGRVRHVISDVFIFVVVLTRTEDCAAFREEVNTQRVEACNQYVNAQVVLPAFDQVRVGNVLLDNVASLVGHVIFGANDRDSFAAPAVRRLLDVHLLGACQLKNHAIILEQGVLLR